MSKEAELKSIELKVSVHCCDGCKRKVKKALQAIEGVIRTEIHPSLPKITVEVRKVEAQILMKKLGKIGKASEIWTSGASGAKVAEKNSKTNAKEEEASKKCANTERGKNTSASETTEKSNKNETIGIEGAKVGGKKEGKDSKDSAGNSNSLQETVNNAAKPCPSNEDLTIRPGIVHYTGDVLLSGPPYPYYIGGQSFVPQAHYMVAAYPAPAMYYQQMSTNQRHGQSPQLMLADYFDDENSAGCSIM